MNQWRCRYGPWVAGVLLLVSATLIAPAQERITLGIARGAGGRLVCDSLGADDWLHVLERSGDLNTWAEVARTHGPWKPYPVPILADGAEVFFRIRAQPKSFDDDWKNQAIVPEDPMFSKGDGEFGSARWIKFAIRLDE